MHRPGTPAPIRIRCAKGAAVPGSIAPGLERPACRSLPAASRDRPQVSRVRTCRAGRPSPRRRTLAEWALEPFDLLCEPVATRAQDLENALLALFSAEFP